MNSQQIKYSAGRGNNSAFSTMAVTYARPIYDRLLARSGNKETAKQALKVALVDMYKTMKTTNCSDPLEAMLYCRAEQAQDEMISKSFEYLINNALSIAALPDGDFPPAKEVTASVIAAEPEVPKAKETQKEERPSPAAPDAAVEMADTKIKPKRTGGIFVVALLGAGIIAMLWVIVGLLMDMGLLPELDLGYLWFNINVAPWF